jgi:hypothetical protein
MYINGYWYLCTVLVIVLHVQYQLLVCMYSTGYWSAFTELDIGLHVL